MSTTIDNRIVQLGIDNKEFNARSLESIGILDKLKNALSLKGAHEGLKNVATGLSNITADVAEKSVNRLAGRFSALEVAGITAIANISNKITNLGTKLAYDAFIAPIKDGFKEYETQMNAIQTIKANTAMDGTTIEQINSALKTLNDYSDKTIYNFSEMAKNIGTFTAAGVKLGPATTAIKGIANLAAQSGSNSQQAATAMYQLSQAISSGSVKLQDWNSVVNAGMGGTGFQEALKTTARVHGVAVDKMIAANGSFRESLKEGWITTEILTETLAQYAGELDATQLKEKGYSDAQIKTILERAKLAEEAATKVKTFTQLMDTLKESLGSGWAQTFGILLGDLNEAQDLFTGISNVLGGLIQRSADARNKMLGDWKALGGRTVLLEGLGRIGQTIIYIFENIGNAWRDAFPATSGATLFKLTQGFNDLTKILFNAVRSFRFVADILGIIFQVMATGWKVVQLVANYFGVLLNVIAGGGAINIKFFRSIRDILKAFNDWLDKISFTTLGMENFRKVVTVLLTPIGLLLKGIQFLSNGVVDLVKMVAGYMSPALLDLSEGFSKVWKSLNIGSAFSNMTGKLSKLGNTFTSIGKLIVAPFVGLGILVKNGFDSLFSPSNVANATSMAAKVFTSIGNVLTFGLNGIVKIIGVGALGIIKGIQLLTSSLNTVLTNILNSGFKEKAISTISTTGASIGKSISLLYSTIVPVIGTLISGLGKFIYTALLTGIKGISTWITTGGLTRLLNAILTIGTEIIKVIPQIIKSIFDSVAPRLSAAFTSISTNIKNGYNKLKASMKRGNDDTAKESQSGITKIAQIVAGLLSGGMLAYAVNMFRRLSDSFKGLLSRGPKAFVGTLEALRGTLESYQKYIKAATIKTIAISIAILAGAVLALALIPPAKVAAGVGALLVIGGGLLTFLKQMDKVKLKATGMASFAQVMGGLIASSIAITLAANALIKMAVAVRLLKSTVEELGQMDWQSLGKGLLGVVTLVLSLSAALMLMKNTNVSASTGLAFLGLAVSIKILANAVKSFGELDRETITQGMIAVEGLLASIVVVAKLTKNIGNLTQLAVALLGIGVSLYVLSGSVSKLGSMDYKVLSQGLTAIALLLGMVTAAVTAMPSNLPVIASGILAVSASVLVLSFAVAKLGKLKWEELAKGLIGTGVLLAELAIFLNLMPKNMPVIAAGLIILSGALVILSKVVSTLGALTLGELLTGLAGLLGMFAALAAGAALISPFIGVLGLFALTLVGLGAGLALVGLGLTKFMNAILMVVGVSAATLTAFMAMLPLLVVAVSTTINLILGAIMLSMPLIRDTLVATGTMIFEVLNALLPQLLTFITNAITQLLVTLTVLLPQIVNFIINAATLILNGLTVLIPKIVTFILQAIQTLLEKMLIYVPKYVDIVLKLVAAFLNTIANNIGPIANAGVNVIISFIKAADKNVGRIADTVLTLIENFLSTLSKNTLRLTRAASNTIIDFINGLANEVRTQGPRMGAAMGNLASAMIDGIVGGLGRGVKRVVEAAGNLAKSAYNTIKEWLNINSPSRKFMFLADRMIEGLVKPKLGRGSLIQDTYLGFAKRAFNAVSNVVSRKQNEVPEEYIAAKPVIDLSEFQNGSKHLQNVSTKGLSTALAQTVDANVNDAITAKVEMANKPDPVVLSLLKELQDVKSQLKQQVMVMDKEIIGHIITDPIDINLGEKALLVDRGIIA